MTTPLFSVEDQQFPYRKYQAMAGLLVHGGAVQMPLAFLPGIPASQQTVACRILQVAQPRSVLQVNWSGTRMNQKPAPPQITASNSFVLALAGGWITGVNKDTSGDDMVTASGFLLLYSTKPPSMVQMPAFWLPWDGRADVQAGSVPTYLYTPADLGFAQFLPGAQQAVPASKIINNPPVSGTNVVQFI